MEQNNNTLNKTQHIKRGKETRLEQVEQELEQEVEEREREFLNYENDEFIERDIEQVDIDDMKTNKNRNKKIKLNQEVKNFDNKKFDEQSKKLLGEVISKSKLDKISKIASSLKQKHNEKQSQMRKSTTNIVKEQLRFKNLDQQIIGDMNFLQNKKQDYLQFFILEAVQNQFKKDTIYLFGKIKGQQGYVNSCVTVTGIKREIYIMPKKGHNIKDVEEEIRGLIQAHPKDKKLNIDYEIVKKKYCFELNVDYRNQEVEVLKLSYPFNHSELKWLKQDGINFKGVFGNSYKPLDLFFLQTKIKGSEWIKISNYKIDRQQKQEKYFNIIIEDYINQLDKIYEIRDPPTVNVAVINLKKSEDKKKIEEIYFSMFNNFNIVKNTFQTSDNFIFRVSGTESIEKKSDQNTGYHLKECDSEHGLMTQFENYFQNADPDIILGHEILSSVLEFYIRRTKELCKDQYIFSRLAKERQMKTINSLKYQLKYVFGGRLIMDLFELSKNLIKLNSYTFDDMILHFFPKNISLTNDTTKKLESNFLLLKIVLKLKIFQLTLQLSQVSGSLWEVSLRQARSLRNEILLSHEFYQQNYILPDNLEYGQKNAGGGYLGGKVFEPEIGFYESYIVLVDFNSLYPSIIRQYNICFSTVQRELIEPGDQVTKIEEDLGEDDPLQHVNVSDQQPILPSILTKLIEKRKAVKNEILKQKKQKSLDKEKEQQLDIQQNALKIMANSIYGCLGFSSSRFYAKKIAMLITAFGRKLLESSRELVEKLGYNVIYGDTDSIMINTMKGNIKEAVINGIEIKKEINQQYKTGKGKAILEVEIDGLFKKLLLLKKKKYAGLKVKNYSDIGKSNFHEQLEMEYKGLDLVRRDWSLLTKQVCIKVLDILMGEQGIDGIFKYLKDVNISLDNFTGSITVIPQDSQQDKNQNSNIIFNINHFKIQKQLQKKTSQYNEQGLPHIKVAIDMQRLFQKTDNELVGHYIPYVIVEGSGSQSQKAFHPSEYLQSLSTETPMKIDIEFYKKNQLLNPLERLIHIIEGFEIEQMNKIFGIENVQNEVVQDDSYDDNERIALKRLPKYFKDFHLDVDDYKNQCFCEKGLQQKCYVFLKCEKQEFLNKLTHVLRNLIKKYGMPYYKCDCGYEIRRVMFQKTCPICENKDLKDQTDSKLLVAKLLFLKELIKVYSESNIKVNLQGNIEKQTSQQMIFDIHKILNHISFEKKNVLLPLKRYNQFVQDNVCVKLFKQL